MVRGIDVSAYQNRVDWARVRTDGIAFVFAKATEGVGFADPKFHAHTNGARAAGLRVGAYHFARPETNSGRAPEAVQRDARAEADWFLRVAAPARGGLLPALDLETGGGSGGLRPDLLVAWTKAWLERVRERIGARPLLYTFPGFWGQLGGTTAFRAYPLWIAHFGVAKPQLPAGWRRYTLWQHTHTGRVSGIAGDVDVDRLDDRLSLADVTYKPDRKPPRAPAQTLPGPVPKPPWFWPWLRWRLGTGEFEGLAKKASLRPDEAPDTVPAWATRCAEKFEAERKRGSGSPA
jgi:GH25 family lysozyme M1 (1,4-beta-N-acetylmuramidase)